MIKSRWMGILFGALAFFATSVYAADTKKIVLQVTDADPAKHNLVLNVAGNLQRLYGLANVEVEVVAFGPGLKMLIPNKKDQKSMKVQSRIDGMAANQVQFSACATTLGKMTKKNNGKKPPLNKNSVVVEGGILRIVELVEKGYILVRP